MELWQTLLVAGGVGVTVVGSLTQLVLWFLKRHAEKQDKKENYVDKAMFDVYVSESKNTIDALAHAQLATMRDRIRYLSLRYLEMDTINYDHFQDLMDLYDAYQCLGGNGSLTVLMQQIKGMRISEREEGQ